MTALLLFLTVEIPHSGALQDHFDLVEVNHYFDSNGRLVFDQQIWWQLDDDGHYQVEAWRMLKGVRGPQKPRPVGDQSPPEFVGGHAAPMFDYTRRLWVSKWFDQTCQVNRVVTATAFKETWTD